MIKNFDVFQFKIPNLAKYDHDYSYMEFQNRFERENHADYIDITTPFTMMLVALFIAMVAILYKDYLRMKKTAVTICTVLQTAAIPLGFSLDACLSNDGFSQCLLTKGLLFTNVEILTMLMSVFFVFYLLNSLIYLAYMRIVGSK